MNVKIAIAASIIAHVDDSKGQQHGARKQIGACASRVKREDLYVLDGIVR